MNCPHAHWKVYDAQKKKGKSDLQALHTANTWCNNIQGCAMRTPSPRGVVFSKNTLNRGNAGVKGTPYIGKGPPAHPTVANKTIYSNNYTTINQEHGKIKPSSYQGG